MKNIFWCLLVGILCVCCENKNCNVNGSVEGESDNTTIYILRRVTEYTFDTIMQTHLKNNTFSFVLPQDLCGEYYHLKIGKKGMGSGFFAEVGDVEIELNGKSYISKVGGTQENDRWQQYSDLTHNKDFRIAQKQSKKYRDSLLVADNNSIAALYMYYQSLPLLKYEQIDSILTKVSVNLSTNRYYREMENRANILRKIAPGAIAPDFCVQGVDGDSIMLSSFRGKYLILDFWASWCIPCRQETKYLRELYKRYNSKGLDIFSISLDDEKEAWVRAIKKDSMVWNHGCQLLKGGKNTPIAKLYGIDGLPAIWVIDPLGKIVYQGTNGVDLIKFCSSIFDD